MIKKQSLFQLFQNTIHNLLNYQFIISLSNFSLNFDRRDESKRRRRRRKKRNEATNSLPSQWNGNIEFTFRGKNDSSTCWNLHYRPYYITFHKRNGFNFPPCAPWKQFSNGEPAQLRSHFRQNRIGREWNLSIQWFEVFDPGRASKFCAFLSFSFSNFKHFNSIGSVLFFGANFEISWFYFQGYMFLLFYSPVTNIEIMLIIIITNNNN